MEEVFEDRLQCANNLLASATSEYISLFSNIKVLQKSIKRFHIARVFIGILIPKRWPHFHSSRNPDLQ